MTRNDATKMTLYTNATRTNPNPPKIDYIIFLDSDDYWEANLLESCIDSAQKYNAPDIVWFEHNIFYDDIVGGGDYTTQLEVFGYNDEQTITFIDLLHRAKERKIHTFWWAWEGLIDFRLLREIRLKFIEGIIHEDHHFGALLFAQSRNIHILPRKLYNYRIRANSTMTAWSENEIPSYLKPLLAHFDYGKAREYFRIYSLFITAREIYDFSKNSVVAELRADFENLTLPYLIDIICDIYKIRKDPYCLKPQMAELLKSFRVDSVILPHNIKKHFRFYTMPILWNFFWVISLYEWLKGLERKFRRWRRGKKEH